MQQLKLELLMKTHAEKGKPKRGRKDGSRFSDSNSNSDSAASSALSGAAAMSTPHPQKKQQQLHRQAFSDLRALETYLAPRLTLEVGCAGFAALWSHLLSVLCVFFVSLSVLQTSYAISAHHLLQLRATASEAADNRQRAAPRKCSAASIDPLLPDQFFKPPLN